MKAALLPWVRSSTCWGVVAPPGYNNSMKNFLARAVLGLAILAPLTAFAAGAGFNLKSTGKEWMFNVTSANNKIVLTSERYSSKQMAEKGIASVKANGRNP